MHWRSRAKHTAGAEQCFRLVEDLQGLLPRRLLGAGCQPHPQMHSQDRQVEQVGPDLSFQLGEAAPRSRSTIAARCCQTAWHCAAAARDCASDSVVALYRGRRRSLSRWAPGPLPRSARYIASWNCCLSRPWKGTSSTRARPCGTHRGPRCPASLIEMGLALLQRGLAFWPDASPWLTPTPPPPRTASSKPSRARACRRRRRHFRQRSAGLRLAHSLQRQVGQVPAQVGRQCGGRRVAPARVGRQASAQPGRPVPDVTLGLSRRRARAGRLAGERQLPPSSS